MPDPSPDADKSSHEARPARGRERAMPVVGIGASAGGLEALTQLFAKIPSDIGMAFVVVVHLDPHHESQLSELVSKSSGVTVTEARDGEVVAAGRAYVIPPNASITIESSILRLRPRREGRVAHMPVDQFLRSLAEDQGTSAVAIILSGTGSDGTQGLAEIKAAGGITFAQDPSTAKYDGMPASAIASGAVDFVLPVAEIPRELARLRTHPYLVQAEAEAAADEASFRRIAALIRSAYGVDIQHYRPSTMRRRILRRMALQNLADLASYARALALDPVEVAALYEDLMISVTSFFRDPELFEELKSSVFPELLERRAGETIRVWVVGCSTGQEAYSMAIALTEFLDGKPRAPTIQVFATDVNESTSLARARAGMYPPSIEAEVSPERLRRFFRKEENGSYRVHKSIRDLCVFAKQNVMADPPFSRIDLLACRNVLIYLSSATQKVVVPTFHYALAPEGFLVLGASETANAYADLFAIVDRVHKIYRKRGGSKRYYPHFDTAHEHGEPTSVAVRQAGEHVPSSADWQREADRVALGSFVPASLLVAEDLDIVEFRGDVSPFLAPHPGEASLNVLRMVREGLSMKLKEAIDEVRTTRIAAQRNGVRLWEDAAGREVDIEVMPLRIPGSVHQSFLVLFRNSAEARGKVPGTAGTRGSWRARLIEKLGGSKPPDSEELLALREELETARRYLRSILDQREAANEELRSANEEILSSNEELQSTNEELQTTKEELQSLNEELTTVNEQLQHKNLDLNALNNDLENLLASAKVPVVMVNRDLRIRRFNEPAGQLMNLMAGDAGRPLGQIKHALEVDDMHVLLERVIDQVQMIEREVRTNEGRWYLMRLHPYRTSDNRIDGAVIVLFDIHDMKVAQAAWSRERELSEAIVETVSQPLLVLDAGLRVRRANRSYCDLFSVKPADVEGRDVLEIADGQWNAPPLRALMQQSLLDRRLISTLELDHEFARLGRRVLSVVVRRLRTDAEEDAPLILLAMEDVTERRLRQQGLEAADRNKDEFMAVLAHELRNPLAAIDSAIKLVRMPGVAPGEVAWSHEVIGRQVGNIVRLVDDMLDVTRLNTGKIELELTALDLGEAVREALDEVKPMVDRLKHRVTVRVEPARLLVVADQARLHQILVNLLTNAAKYTDAGGQIWIEAREHSGGVVVTVQDNGIGMPASLVARVFDAFVQADHSLARAQGGLGLGLTLVKKLVAMHGGSVTASSDGPGRGSTFTVRLPARDPSVLIPAAPPTPSVEPSRASRRVLLAEDNEDTLKAMSIYLERHGHAVLTANDAPLAYEIVVREKPDVAVLDLGLPTMSGFALAERIRSCAEADGIQLIALSGYGRDEDKERARQAGFDLHFTKPVDHAKILAAIQDGTAPKQSRLQDG